MQPGQEKIVRNLQDAVERLRKDIVRVELWADALQGFLAPVPGYDSPGKVLDRFSLTPPAPDAQNENGSGADAPVTSKPQHNSSSSAG